MRACERPENSIFSYPFLCTIVEGQCLTVKGRLLQDDSPKIQVCFSLSQTFFIRQIGRLVLTAEIEDIYELDLTHWGGGGREGKEEA